MLPLRRLLPRLLLRRRPRLLGQPQEWLEAFWGTVTGAAGGRGGGGGRATGAQTALINPDAVGEIRQPLGRTAAAPPPPAPATPPARAAAPAAPIDRPTPPAPNTEAYDRIT